MCHFRNHTRREVRHQFRLWEKSHLILEIEKRILKNKRDKADFNSELVPDAIFHINIAA